MNGIYGRSRETMSKDTTGFISLPESADGTMRLAWPDGQMSLFGRGHALANRFRAPASNSEKKTTGTCGRNSTASYASVALAQSLVNRLRREMDLNGSMEYRLIWKRSVMPSGRSIYRLRASGLRTSGSGFGGWPTPNVPDGGRSPKGGMSNTGMTLDGKKRQVDLQWVAKSITGWPTPCQQDGPKGGPGQGEDRLPGAAMLAGWHTPMTSTTSRSERFKAGCSQLSPEECLGLNPNSSNAGTESSGASLNPLFSLWLMGYSLAWAIAAMKISKKR